LPKLKSPTNNKSQQEEEKEDKENPGFHKLDTDPETLETEMKLTKEERPSVSERLNITPLDTQKLNIGHRKKSTELTETLETEIESE